VLWACKEGSQNAVVLCACGDSRATADHYIKKDWNQLIFYEPGT